MTHQLSDATVFETVMELLTDAGFDGFAEVFRLLVNQAMRIERSEALAGSGRMHEVRRVLPTAATGRFAAAFGRQSFSSMISILRNWVGWLSAWREIVPPVIILLAPAFSRAWASLLLGSS